MKFLKNFATRVLINRYLLQENREQANSVTFQIFSLNLSINFLKNEAV